MPATHIIMCVLTALVALIVGPAALHLAYYKGEWSLALVSGVSLISSGVHFVAARDSL